MKSPLGHRLRILRLAAVALGLTLALAMGTPQNTLAKTDDFQQVLNTSGGYDGKPDEWSAPGQHLLYLNPEPISEQLSLNRIALRALINYLIQVWV